MTPQQQYQQYLLAGKMRADPAQGHAIAALERVYQALALPQRQPQRSWWLRWFTPSIPSEPIFGLYMWGGVGRGKTCLMDIFFASLPSERKMRCHFHRFMLHIHSELKVLSGQADPLEIVAKNLAQKTDVLCFDEFFVSDITDAMLLGTLLERLFAKGVTLVATSNMAPAQLYPNGLQRARFLPAIALLERHCQVLNVDGGEDYRLRTLSQAPVYHYPLNDQAKNALDQCFATLTQGQSEIFQRLTVNQRQLHALAWGEGVLYIDFAQLCMSPRSASDYIEIAKQFHTVLLANVEVMARESDDVARRFITMVDQFYERQVNLIISAAQPLALLYSEGGLNFEFARCLSRLTEMQSHEYLARGHLP